MKDSFLTNYTDTSFLERIKDNLKRCRSFCFSVSFIKKAGLILLDREIENALKNGAQGRIITSTYQNFTDIPSLELFLEWQKKYSNFECHLDIECFGENGFHTKGYLFDNGDSKEIIIGSSNLTRFALLKNIEWNISLFSDTSIESYNNAYLEFEQLWDRTLELDENLIDQYKLLLDYAIEKWDMDYINPNALSVNPNAMQRKALKEIRRYRDMGVDKALVISATGSGKTYLAAFDARNFEAKRLLYIVHRDFILKDALKTFLSVFGTSKTYGMYTGSKNEIDNDFVFASTAMISRHLDDFSPNEFDYIVYDEVHHIVADSGQKIFEYFKPEFILGLTATPERMDNKDVFGLFDQNIPYELRLRDAILNDLVVPFEYYGIRTQLADYSDKDRMKVAREIARTENVSFISTEIEKHKKQDEKLKCIAFCTNLQHCSQMAEEFNENGYHAIALTGKNDLGERIKAFKELQDDESPLEIICAVDILNEGVDIPQINLVLFLRPTESQTVFLQQLGRGLRKYPGKDKVTVLDFIGNNYQRSVQIAMALGTLSTTPYTEKQYLKDMIRTDFSSLEIPGVVINIDELSKEEIIHYIDNTNFNTGSFLKKDYENFKKYVQSENYPSHMDYLDYEIAPNLDRFIKSNMKGGKNKSYYSFLKKIEEENLPEFTKEEIGIIDRIEDLLPIVRIDEFAILKQYLEEAKIDLDEINKLYPNTSKESLQYAYAYLIKQNILGNDSLDLVHTNEDFRSYLDDAINYGITRYGIEFGDFDGKYKLYRNYYKEQVAMILLKMNMMDLIQPGTYYDPNNPGDTYIFVGLKKDDELGKLNYKDKFLNSTTMQWESKNNTTLTNSEGKRILATKRVYLFVRKVDREDGIVLPFTYFGTAKIEHIRESFTEENGEQYPTLLCDLKLNNEVPRQYHLDFEIPDSE